MNGSDFIDARRRIEAKSGVNRVKLASIVDAVQLVKDDDCIAIGGCLYSRTPLALLMEVLRQGR